MDCGRKLPGERGWSTLRKPGERKSAKQMEQNGGWERNGERNTGEEHFSRSDEATFWQEEKEERKERAREKEGGEGKRDRAVTRGREGD